MSFDRQVVSLTENVHPKVMVDGEMDAGAWNCGMVVGLINDIPTVKELIDRIMTEAAVSSSGEHDMKTTKS